MLALLYFSLYGMVAGEITGTQDFSSFSLRKTSVVQCHEAYVKGWRDLRVIIFVIRLGLAVNISWVTNQPSNLIKKKKISIWLVAKATKALRNSYNVDA